MTPKRYLWCSLALVVALGACVPPEPEEDLIRDFDPETTVMGAIQEDGVLEVGIAGNPALYREVAGEPAGLGADLALEVAGTLGVEADFTVATDEELLEMVEDGDVDLALPLTPVVETLVRTAGVSDPYFIAHQRLLVPAGSPAGAVEDLEGEVCAVGYAETLVSLEELNPGLTITGPGTAAECYDDSKLFEDRRLVPPVMTGLDLDLVGAAYSLQGLCPPEARCLAPEIVGDELTTAGISMFVEKGASGWLGFVDNVLGEYKSEGLWLESYNASLESYLGAQRAPEITVEEAAALYPREL
jgi:ABC-type amino acid transport substrate-binding protein